ncbi:hypothetical protein [Streptomyces sp. P17]|uniref:hypothetical protein n=1 Tax=Streptomyces sp. P17 TaxID=3074716 RepID=UPI0028F40F01|nr:hypothetical protein [Streptomyces sp. P17]MDT9700847.1 hypothetical protein [Streptomyces sp. P17]
MHLVIEPRFARAHWGDGVGRWHAERAAAGAGRREADRRARWEEARWQVQHVIATEPVPFGETRP